MLKFDDVLNNNPNDIKQVVSMQAQLQHTEPINIQFTSGTTGFPKAAVIHWKLTCEFHSNELTYF